MAIKNEYYVRTGYFFRDSVDLPKNYLISLLQVGTQYTFTTKLAFIFIFYIITETEKIIELKREWTSV